MLTPRPTLPLLSEGHGARPAGVSRRAWLRLALASLLASATRAPAAEAPEYRIKATWMVNFARFIDWPAASFADADAPIILGVLGKDPFGAELEATVKGVTVKGRSLVVRRFTADQDFSRCHILFISASERRRQRDCLQRLKQAPVLTVGENDDFLAHGGVVNFRLKEGAVRFDINVDAAQPAGLRISAQLLRVAASVNGRYETGPNE